MYRHTHNGMQRKEWPDGGEYLNQMAIVPEMWDIIAEEIKGVSGG